MELLDSIDAEEVDIAVLARKVALDQALTAKTLRVANSALYGLRVRMTTIQQAITYLGFQTARNLITAAALTGCFPENRCAGFSHPAFWRHAIATAICAKALARHAGFNQDYAFTAGLLHDVGRLALVSCFPGHYAAVIAWRAAHDVHWIDAERSVLGIDHVDAGLALAEHWNFSATMRGAIGHHHAPDLPGAGMLATIVHVADAIAHALDLAGVPDELVPPVSAAAWHALELDEETCRRVFEDTRAQFEGMAPLLLP
ncbi:HDOD domain-containing protein [Massilia sp. METH4]|uniref:HDOD domain-containing protein n=1 Tax=Massilia sp. METH4 TaxID=3123041 RepID=UPI0030CAAB03